MSVRGQSAAQSGGIKLFLTNAEDQRTAYYEYRDQRREYDFVRGPEGVKLTAQSQTPEGSGVWYVTREVDGGTDYEIGLPVWELANAVNTDPDRWVKLSVAVLDAGGKGYWQWYGGAAEPKNWGAYGDFQMAANGRDEWGQQHGAFFDSFGPDRSGFVGLALLPDGGRVLVRATPHADGGEALVQDAQGQVLRHFPVPTGQKVHTVLVDQDGRLAIGDRTLGVNFYSLEDGHKLVVGPLRSFYPERHCLEYRTQGLTQDTEGNYFVTVERKRRNTEPRLGGGEDDRLTLLSGVTLCTRQGDEVKEFGYDLPFTSFGVIHAWGRMGEAAGEFLQAESVAVDSQKRLWVADTDANTLQVFARTGAQAWSYDRLPLLYANLPPGFFPYHLQALTDGRILLWNAQQMAVARLQDGQLVIGQPVAFAAKIEDLKIKGAVAVTLTNDGSVAEVPWPK